MTGTPQPNPDYGAAARATIILLALQHHQERTLDVRELIADADPVEVATFLATMVLQLLAADRTDAGRWLTNVGCRLALGTQPAGPAPTIEPGEEA